MSRIYLDHAATTPLDPRVLEAMQPYLGPEFHNPSSLYHGGRAAAKAVDQARDTVAEALGCLPGDVVFTASGTEAANLAILGTALQHRDGSRKTILFSGGEHQCVLSAAPLLRSLGYEVKLLPLDDSGAPAVDDAVALIGNGALLVCVMHSNNETGALSDVAAIRKACAEHEAIWFCDAVQSFGLTKISVGALGADFVSVSAHKVYGPKGIGALIVPGTRQLQPIITGGEQERGRRAGTENVAGIVGFGEAVRLASTDAGRADRVAEARDEFETSLGDQFAATCSSRPRLPGHSHLRVPGFSAESMLINLDQEGVDAGSGAACSSGSVEPSHVLLNAGWSPDDAKEALRFTFGKDSTVDGARAAAGALRRIARRE